ncbi:MAG: amino acid permease [Candidatus Thermoplasmatota archaeon]
MSAISRGLNRLVYRKNVDRLLAEAHSKEGLKKSLTSKDLLILGVAGIIGAGIFVLVGEGAESAGVGVVPAFAVAALICVVAGYAYAELAASVPASGSAYAYIYTALGELPGWLVAWALVLEYAVGAIAVSIGWRNNLIALVEQYGGSMSYKWTHSPLETVVQESIVNGQVVTTSMTGIINLPSIAIVAACAGILYFGTKESARLTAVLVAIKVAILLLAIGVGMYLFEFSNLTGDRFWPGNGADFMESLKAVFAAGAIMFFAYIGFDSVSTTAEETKNPKKDLPIGILGSLIITTVLYIAAATVLIGAAPSSIFVGFSEDAQQARGEPFGYVFENADKGGAFVEFAASLVRIGALIGTTSVLLVLILGGVRVFFNMSRDGLLPAWMSKVSSRGTPGSTTLLYGGFTMVFAGFLTLGSAVELVNIGTLFAFVMVVLGAWIFRIRRPDVERPFKMPMWSIYTRNGKPYVPLFVIFGVIGILALIFSLTRFTLVAFVTWAGIGLLVYALYGIRNSKEAHARHGGHELPDPFTGGKPAGDLGGSQRADAEEEATQAVAAKAARPAPAKPHKAGKAFTHNGFTLYARETNGRNLYFFARNEPKSGHASALPAGYEVGENSKTGLPFLRKA